MKEFEIKRKTFVKSNNSLKKFNLTYTYTLIAYIIYSIIYYITTNSKSLILSLIYSLIISLILTTITQYIINIIKKDYKLKTVFTYNNIIPISLIMSLFLVDKSLLISIISISITIIIKNIYKGINLSSTLYGILFIYLYQYYTNQLITPLTNLESLNYISTYDQIITNKIITYITSINYLSPALAIISFIYIFYKKTIKYNIIIPYIITLSIIFLTFGLFNNMGIWFLFIEITTGNLLFLSIYCLTDSAITPLTQKGQIIYGILVAIITAILRFIIPELSVIIALIISPILLTKLINKISPKLEYNRKYYKKILISTIILSIIVTTSLIIII